jgi:glycosyltransferase involved in cell wall biosynthesis
MKFGGDIFVIPHGCPEIREYKEIWNIFQTPYLIFGYGFGFKYKGVEVAIDAVKYLKENDPKFKNILYVYACSESETSKGINNNYYNSLVDKMEKENLTENILLLKGFLQPEILDVYLKTVKMVIFPYVSDPIDGVFGSSGAIKIAMSYNIPVIASKSHLFDDVDGHVIRAEDYKELATEIDKIFSNSTYRQETIDKAHDYINKNTWKLCSDKYIDVVNKITNFI